MTKNDFIQKAVLNMCANSNYNRTSNKDMIYHAEELADNLEFLGFDFDDASFETVESMKTHIGSIAEALTDIRDAINSPNGGDLSALQEIATILHEKFSPVTIR